MDKKEELRTEFNRRTQVITETTALHKVVAGALNATFEWFYSIIERKNDAIKYLEVFGNYDEMVALKEKDSQIQELQSIITSRDEVIKNREYELDGAVEKYRELQREIERLKSEKL